MTIEEFYEEIGSNWDDVFNRLHSKEMIKKFVSAFSSDNNFDDFSAAYKNADYETAFRAVHTLKGLCLNLGFDRLAGVCINATEALRGGKNELTPQMLFDLEDNYKKVSEAISKIS